MHILLVEDELELARGIQTSLRLGHYAVSHIVQGKEVILAAESGDANRFLLKDGVRYSHVLDPKTGQPIIDAPASVTFAGDNCTQAGLLSTMALLQGKNTERFLVE